MNVGSDSDNESEISVEELEFSETECWTSSENEDEEEWDLEETHQETAHLASIICLPVKAADADPTMASAFIRGDSGPFPRAFRIAVKLNGANHTATVDNGASATFMHPATANIRGLKTHRYEVPKTLCLGTKGSKAKINAFCFAELTVGVVKKRQRFELAMVEDEVLIGRDFLRAHDCAI